MTYPSFIIDGLYLGPYTSAQSKDILDELSINTIINMTSEYPNFYQNQYSYINIKLHDTMDEDIYSHFDKLANIIDNLIKNKKNVLVHCAAGQSRSASIVLAYFIKIKKMSLKSAISFVKEKRSCISPNIHFIRSLIRYEKEQHGVTSVCDRDVLIEYLINIFPNTSIDIFNKFLASSNDLNIVVANLATFVYS